MALSSMFQSSCARVTHESCPQLMQTSDAYIVLWLEFVCQLRHFRAAMTKTSAKRLADDAFASKVAASLNAADKAASGSGTCAAEDLISPKKPRIDERAESVPRMPDLPGNHVHVSTYMLMRQVVPFVMHALPGALDELGIQHETELVACPLLQITASEKWCASQLQGGVEPRKLQDVSRDDQHVRGWWQLALGRHEPWCSE